MLKIGIIGAGFIGMQHIEAIRRVVGVEIVAISGRDQEKLQQYVENGICKRVYTDYKQMIDNEELDAVHNCTPTNLHYEVNKYAIEKGINIYGEKPLVKNLSEGEELVRLVRETNVIGALNFNYRNNLLVQEMRSRINDEKFGRPLFVQGEYLQDWLMFESDFDWRLDPEIGGESRALADIGSHCIDIMQFVLNKKVISVNARLFTVHDKRRKYKNAGTFSQSVDGDYEVIDVQNEDGGVILAEFEDGIIGSFTISQVSSGKKNGLKINVSGENYGLEWNQEQSDRLWVGHRDEGNQEIYADAKYVSDSVKQFATLPNGHPVGWHDALTNSIRSFYTAIKENTDANDSTFATFADGLYVMKVINACLESNKTNKWINIVKED